MRLLTFGQWPFAEFITAVLFTILFAALFGLLFDRTGAWPGIGWFFLIVLLGAWAVGARVEPVGPVVYSVSWLPFFFGALILALLVAAMSEPAPRVPEGHREPMVAVS